MTGKQVPRLTAEEYFLELTASTLDERLKRSLTRIKLACDRIEAEAKAARNGSSVSVDRPLSIVNVGRRCVEMFGGPSPQSITNNRAKEPHKARYIELRAAELGDSISKRARDDRLDVIADPRVRLYVKSLEHRIDELLKIVRGYSKRFREASPAGLSDMLDAGTDLLSTPASPPVRTTSKALRDAVQRLTSTDSLASVGLSLENDYVFEAISQNELLQPHHLHALRELLNLSTG